MKQIVDYIIPPAPNCSIFYSFSKYFENFIAILTIYDNQLDIQDGLFKIFSFWQWNIRYETTYTKLKWAIYFTKIETNLHFT